MNIRSTIFLFFLLFADTAFAQKLEIMIVGSAHDNPPGYDNFEKIVDKLKSFKPDMVFGEYVPDIDSSVMESDRANAE